MVDGGWLSLLYYSMINLDVSSFCLFALMSTAMFIISFCEHRGGGFFIVPPVKMLAIPHSCVCLCKDN